MAIAEMKKAVIAEINKMDNLKDLIRVSRLLSKIALAKEKNPWDLTQHYEIVKRRHKEIIKELSK